MSALVFRHLLAFDFLESASGIVAIEVVAIFTPPIAIVIPIEPAAGSPVTTRPSLFGDVEPWRFFGFTRQIAA
jgi:hypothetical protein